MAIVIEDHNNHDTVGFHSPHKDYRKDSNTKGRDNHNSKGLVNLFSDRIALESEHTDESQWKCALGKTNDKVGDLLVLTAKEWKQQITNNLSKSSSSFLTSADLNHDNRGDDGLKYSQACQEEKDEKGQIPNTMNEQIHSSLKLTFISVDLDAESIHVNGLDLNNIRRRNLIVKLNDCVKEKVSNKEKTTSESCKDKGRFCEEPHPSKRAKNPTFQDTVANIPGLTFSSPTCENVLNERYIEMAISSDGEDWRSEETNDSSFKMERKPNEIIAASSFKTDIIGKSQNNDDLSIDGDKDGKSQENNDRIIGENCSFDDLSIDDDEDGKSEENNDHIFDENWKERENSSSSSDDDFEPNINSDNSGDEDYTPSENNDSSDADMKHSHCYICKICGEEFQLHANYHKHIKRHSYEKNSIKPRKCQLCFKVCKSYRNYHYHMTTKHTEPVMCSFCGQTFPDFTRLRCHEDKHQGKIKKFTCDTCGKVFSTRGNLLKHCNNVHSEVRNHLCRHCGKCFKSAHALKRHELIHNTEYSFKCKICEKGFKHQPGLRKHELTNHVNTEKKYKCASCDKWFRGKSGLSQHELVHKDKRFTCEFCGKKFTMRHHLGQHLKTHTNERPYVCTLCGDGFKIGHHLTQHMATHGEKPRKK